MGQSQKRQGNWRAVCSEKLQARFGGGLGEKAAMTNDLARSLSYGKEFPQAKAHLTPSSSQADRPFHYQLLSAENDDGIKQSSGCNQFTTTICEDEAIWGTRTHSVHVQHNMNTDPEPPPPSAFCRWRRHGSRSLLLRLA